jgi:carbon-monoxide dehydrogenase small subunit
MARITITVNGVRRTLEVEEDRLTLLDLLREKLELTGTKYGCGVGQCGACTVIMNGEATASCLVRARKADGAEILTIEGLARGTKLHPIQEAFIESGAVQCGYCTPGFIMRTYDLLTRRPEASEEQMLEALNKHLCRCTGYESILEAVKLAQKKMRPKAR